MEIFDFLNKNPALISIVAFPLGLILTLAVARKYIFAGFSGKLEKWFSAYIEGYSKHTEAEVKIEERLRQLVDKVEEMLSHTWDMRRFFDARVDDVTDRLDAMNGKIDKLTVIVPKRKSDLHENNTREPHEN